VSRVVLHLCRGREWRGGERQVLLLVRTLADRDALPQLVLTGRGSRLERELASARLPVSGVPWAIGWDPRALRALFRQVHSLQRDGQQPILHAHDSHALTLALLCARRRHVPVIATRRSMTVPGAQWRRPEFVIAISKAVAESLRDAGVAAERIVVAPSAVAGEQFRERATSRPPGAPPLIVAMGAPTDEKGHDTLREAVAQLDPRPQLSILEDGIEEAVLNAASVFVQPSQREALGTAVLVAMARGIPVIASRTGGLTELLEGDAGLLVPPGDARALAGAIRRLLDDAPLRASLVRTARRRVEDYRPARMADQVTDVYASVHCKP
jgi:glycosyltransferase involved in cell wall biosynthesis